MIQNRDDDKRPTMDENINFSHWKDFEIFNQIEEIILSVDKPICCKQCDVFQLLLNDTLHAMIQGKK